MQKKDLEFCELLCAKFCHDLSGPIGAINNGIDFLDSDNVGMKEKAADLVKLSSNQAVNRLAFFRQAYGSYTIGSKINISQLKSLINKYTHDTKIRVELVNMISQDLEIDHLLSKVLLNFMVIASGIVLLNGNVEIDFCNDEAMKTIKINATGPVAKVDEDLKSILEGGVVEKTTRNVQQLYTKHLLDSASIKTEVQNDKSGIKIELTI
ncbi:MAG: histidine phosphotransferase family protein [Rickettsiales bacterium]